MVAYFYHVKKNGCLHRSVDCGSHGAMPSLLANESTFLFRQEMSLSLGVNLPFILVYKFVAPARLCSASSLYIEGKYNFICFDENNWFGDFLKSLITPIFESPQMGNDGTVTLTQTETAASCKPRVEPHGEVKHGKRSFISSIVDWQACPYTDVVRLGLPPVFDQHTTLWNY
jgi:hypothetical protein